MLFNFPIEVFLNLNNNSYKLNKVNLVLLIEILFNISSSVVIMAFFRIASPIADFASHIYRQH